MAMAGRHGAWKRSQQVCSSQQATQFGEPPITNILQTHIATVFQNFCMARNLPFAL